MKKDNVTPVKVYRNEKHEASTKTELEKARQSLQAVLDKWLSLELGSCKDISGLILRPRIMYDQAVSDLIKVPESSGPFKLDKNKYRDQLTLPDPSGLLEARNKALEQTYCAIPELWKVSGDQVVMNQDEAESLINSQSIYVIDPEKRQLAEDILKYIELTNSLNTKIELFDSSSPISNKFFFGKFTFEGGDARGNNATLVLLPDKLRAWLA